MTDLLQPRSGFHQRYEPMRWEGEIERVGMNLVVIEEHQVGNLVFAQCNYLYISLKATLACVIVPVAKVPWSKYSSYKYWKRMESHRASADMGGNGNMMVQTKGGLSWDTRYHVSGPNSRLENSPQGCIYEKENIRRSIRHTGTTPITRHRICVATMKMAVNESTTRRSKAVPWDNVGRQSDPNVEHTLGHVEPTMGGDLDIWAVI